jgi:DNA-binding NtrC family response regulator
MLIPGCAESETRSEPHDAFHLLRPLRVYVATSAETTPREMTAAAAVEAYAKTTDPLWITAEVGAGASWFAQSLYDRSTDGGPFVRQECEHGIAPVIPEGRGLLFLNHVERLTTDHQEQLCSGLKRSDLRHLEGLRTIPPAPRMVVWSTSSIEELVQTGKLNPSIAQTFTRLTVRIPPLRNQPESIGTFADAVLAQIAAHEGLTMRRLSSEALAVLSSYHWPGNLTELHSMLERACLLADPSHDLLEVTDLPVDMQSRAPATRPSYETSATTTPAMPAATPATIKPPHQPRTMQEIEAEAIRAAIEHNNGNLVRAARELRIGRATLYRKLKKYGIPTRSERRKQLMQ